MKLAVVNAPAPVVEFFSFFVEVISTYDRCTRYACCTNASLAPVLQSALRLGYRRPLHQRLWWSVLFLRLRRSVFSLVVLYHRVMNG